MSKYAGARQARMRQGAIGPDSPPLDFMLTICNHEVFQTFQSCTANHWPVLVLIYRLVLNYIYFI